jgi:RNA polymerase sigma factor (sigma-70 family)
MAGGEAAGELDTMARERAVRTAFEEHAAEIHRFIYAKVGNRAAAEDLTSVVFLKAVRWIAADRSADSVRAWLYATARTSIADHWRAQAQADRATREVAERLLFCDADSPQALLRTRERAERILAALPEREREVLRLRFLHDLDSRRIAAALGITPGHARVVQLRALRRAAALDERSAA